MSVIHRTIVLTTNGNITDDFKPVYRAVLNFRHGWDIYNEHFDYVDPHYLYPPGGTLMMAPFGYLPFAPSRYLFIADQHRRHRDRRVLAAADVQLHPVLGGRARPAAGHVLHRNRDQHAGFHQHQRLHPAGWRCCSCAGCWTARASRQWWAGLAIGLTLVVKPVLWPLLLLPLLNRQWRALVAAFVVPLVINLAAWPLVSHPMDFVTRTVPYILGIRDYFNSSIEGNGVYFGLPTWLIVFLRILFTLLAIGSSVAAVPLLPHPRPAVLVHHTRRACCCCGRGWCCRWPRATTR